MLRLAFLLALVAPAAALAQNDAAFERAETLTRLPTHVGGFDLLFAQEAEEGGATGIQARYVQFADTSNVTVTLFAYADAGEDFEEWAATMERGDLDGLPGSAAVYVAEEGRQHGYVVVDRGAGLVAMASSETYGVDVAAVLRAVYAAATGEASGVGGDDGFHVFQQALPPTHDGRALHLLGQMPRGSTSLFGGLPAPDYAGPWTFLAGYRAPDASPYDDAGVLSVLRIPEGEALELQAAMLLAMEEGPLRRDTTVAGIPAVLLRPGEARTEGEGFSSRVSIDKSTLIVPAEGYRVIVEAGEGASPADLIAFAEAVDLEALLRLPPPRVRPPAPPRPAPPPGWGEQEELPVEEEVVVEQEVYDAADLDRGMLPPPPPPPDWEERGAEPVEAEEEEVLDLVDGVESASLFGAFDRDADRLLTEEEYRIGGERRGLFGALDADGDTFITGGELRGGVPFDALNTDADRFLSKDEFYGGTFRAYDADADGYLSEQEFGEAEELFE